MSEPENETLAQFVDRVMRQKGLSVRDVQKRASGKGRIAASYISRIINGKVKNLSADKIVILAEGLGVDPFQVFAVVSGRKPAPTEPTDPLLILEVMRYWLHLSPEYKIAALNWMRFLAEEDKAKKKGKKKR